VDRQQKMVLCPDRKARAINVQPTVEDLSRFANSEVPTVLPERPHVSGHWQELPAQNVPFRVSDSPSSKSRIESQKPILHIKLQIDRTHVT
jgi:hypothetical protein